MPGLHQERYSIPIMCCRDWVVLADLVYYARKPRPFSLRDLDAFSLFPRLLRSLFFFAKKRPILTHDGFAAIHQTQAHSRHHPRIKADQRDTNDRLKVNIYLMKTAVQVAGFVLRRWRVGK